MSEQRLFLIDRGGALRVPFFGSFDEAKTRARVLANSWRVAVAVVDPQLLSALYIVDADEACAPGRA